MVAGWVGAMLPVNWMCRWNDRVRSHISEACLGGEQRDKISAGEFSNKLGWEGKRREYVIMHFEKEGGRCLGTQSRENSRKLERSKVTIWETLFLGVLHSFLISKTGITGTTLYSVFEDRDNVSWAWCLALTRCLFLCYRARTFAISLVPSLYSSHFDVM